MSVFQLRGVDDVVIERVSGPIQTRNPHVQQFLIDAHQVGRETLHEQYETINQWAASLCQRSMGQSVSVTWKRSPFGKDLVAVTPHLVEVER